MMKEVYEETPANSTHIPGILKTEGKIVPECLSLLKEPENIKRVHNLIC
jgi:hypothetical protein